MSTPSFARLRQLLMLGLWCGLAYGFTEAVEFCLLGLVPGALSWRTGNSVRVLWVAPIFYAAVGIVLAAVVAALAPLVRRVDGPTALVFITLVGGSYLGARLQGEIISPTSALLLALGIGTQLTRVFVSRRDRVIVMMRRTLVPLLLLVVLVAAGELTTTWMMERRALAGLPAARALPNVLVLVADTLRADHLSGYGYRRPTTPHLDRLASEGRAFTSAYSNSSWTLPAHASLLTGRRVEEHRAGNERRPYLDAQFPTLAEVLGRAGYASGGFVGNTFWVGRQTGLARGFIRYEDFYGKVGDAMARTVLGRIMAYELLPHAGFIDIPGRMSAGDINGRVLRWIDMVGDRPFFAFANYMDVHGPYIAPPPFDGRFAGRPLDRQKRKIDMGAVDDETTVPEPEVLREWIDRYDESLAYLDDQVGRLLDELARRGRLDNTIVVFTSDHGEGWGEHNLIYHGHSLYQDQIRIPLIVRFPAQIAAGERDPRPVALDQIPALVTRLAGVTDSPFPRGFSIAQATDGTNVAVSQVGRRRGVPVNWPTASGGLRSIATERFQLIVRDIGPTELYDLQADPAEANNLAGDNRFAGVLSELQQRLASEMRPPSASTARRD